MTIICAKTCKDGIVVGADSQATITTSGGTIKHHISKLHRIGNNTILAASGTIGLIQKSTAIVMEHATVLDESLRYATLEDIKGAVFPILKAARDFYVDYHKKTEGIPCIDMAIIGMDTDKPRIWHMAGDAHDEFIDAVGMWATGSGETVGYTLMKSFDFDGAGINDTILTMYRTLRDAIDTLGSGVGGPIEIHTLSKRDTWEAKALTDSDMESVEKRYQIWKAFERKNISSFSQEALT